MRRTCLIFQCTPEDGHVEPRDLALTLGASRTAVVAHKSGRAEERLALRHSSGLVLQPVGGDEGDAVSPVLDD